MRPAPTRRTAGVEVLRTAGGDVAKGRESRLRWSRREQPESAGDRAFGVTRYRLISGPERAFIKAPKEHREKEGLRSFEAAHGRSVCANSGIPCQGPKGV
jgi:hypothetical protein